MMTPEAITLDRDSFTATQYLPDLAAVQSQTGIAVFAEELQAVSRTGYSSVFRGDLPFSVPPVLILFDAGHERQMILHVETGSGGETIVSHPRLHAYGVGDTPEEAVADFSSMLRDLFEELVASEPTLSRRLRQQLNYLRRIFF